MTTADDDYSNTAASLVRKWLDWAFTLAAARTHGYTYKRSKLLACIVRAHIHGRHGSLSSDRKIIAWTIHYELFRSRLASSLFVRATKMLGALFEKQKPPILSWRTLVVDTENIPAASLDSILTGFEQCWRWDGWLFTFLAWAAVDSLARRWPKGRRNAGWRKTCFDWLRPIIRSKDPVWSQQMSVWWWIYRPSRLPCYVFCACIMYVDKYR